MERGEVARDAARREVSEEAGITLDTELEVFGFYSNHASFPGDHVVLYTAWSNAKPNPGVQMEIAECGFFPADSLPDGTTGGTRRRVAEVLQNRRPAAEW